MNWDTEFTFPAAPERPGYVFNGWTRRMFPEQFNPGLPGEYWPGDTARTPATMTGHYEGNGFWTVTNNKMEYTACWVSTKQFVPLDVPYTVSRIRDDSYENGLSMLSTKTLRWSTSDERILKVDPETGRITKDSFSFAKIGKVTIIGTEHDAGEPYVRYRIEAKVIWGEPEWFGWIMAILFFGWIWL
ncbi:MAG: hypothetical protein FWC27_04945 [Firmicutes bacterium]|nr:hypothetical protein [Bacillota bacterium]